MIGNQDERVYLLSQLREYRNSWVQGKFCYPGFNEREEFEHLQTFERFVNETPRCFARSTLAGHVTGSALVTDAALSQVLLTHHRKLGKWLQLGGHADADVHPERIALREAREESGLGNLALLPYESFFLLGSCETIPFDLDIHVIPERKDTPAHTHYDIRFLLIADASQPIHRSEESNDLGWIAVDEAYGLTGERSMHRQFDKLVFLRDAMSCRE